MSKHHHPQPQENRTPDELAKAVPADPERRPNPVTSETVVETVTHSAEVRRERGGGTGLGGSGAAGRGTGSGGNGTGGGGGNSGGNGGTPPRGTPDSPFVVALTRSDDPTTEAYEIALWDVIGAASRANSYSVYSEFMDHFFANPSATDQDNTLWQKKRNSAISRPVAPYGIDAWDLVSSATDLFVKHQSGTLSDVDWMFRRQNDPNAVDGIEGRLQTSQAFPPDDTRTEYERRLLAQAGARDGLGTYMELVRAKLSELPTIDSFTLSNRNPGIFIGRIESPLLVELIWSYWMEQGMLVQSMNAVALRFQNATSPDLANPLVNLTTDPLRPLSNLLWGFVQTKGDRLPIARRAYEYAHAYGLELTGKAVPPMNVAESRSRFFEAFHTLVASALGFYKEHDDLTVKADGFPLLHLLNDVHTLLAEGADNQFNDLPWTARSEMMSMQWLLGRGEFREFLGGRVMVPYPEPWMDRVDTMKSLQGWTDVSITAFYWLATYSEQLLLSIRYGNWSMITDGALAARWAERFRYAIQSYAHHYRQVTGVDLALPLADARDGARRFAQPSALIAERIAQKRPRGAIGVERNAALPRPTASRTGVPALPVLPASQRG